jgi:carbonic anhydrase
MTNIDMLLERNRAFARTNARDRVPTIPFIPNRQTFVITCIDPRVDPAAVLGLQLGDAIVDRNVGGRVTPAVLQDVGWISHLHRAKTPDAEWFELAVIHHTDCGSGLLADDALRHAFAHQGGYDDAALAALAVLDPATTVAADVASLLASPMVDPNIRVSGHVYDLATGLVTTVVEPVAEPVTGA